MGRRKALAVAAALALAALPAAAQTPTPGMPEVPRDAAQLYEDVQLLRSIRTLDLTSEQLGMLMQVNTSLLEQAAGLTRLRASTWADAHEQVEAVLEAWMSGETASARNKTAADRAVNRVNEARSEYESTRQRAAEGLYAQLSAEQRALVEAPGVAEERAARIARMGGAESPGQYVLAELDAIRDLMPDEFRMLATGEAQRVARAIVGPDSTDLQQMTAAVLGVLQQVYGWTPQRYLEQRPTLPQQIEALLGIQALAKSPPVPWSELVRLTASTRTSVVVMAIVPPGGGEVE